FALLAGGLISTGLVTTLWQSSKLVAYYPNLNPILPALETETARARNVLVDDSAVRYYLYPRLSTDRVTDPFFFQYKGDEVLAARVVSSQSEVYDFAAGAQDWGGHPDDGELEPGLQVAVSHDRTFNDQATLQFTANERASLVGLRRSGPVAYVRAQLYVAPAD